MKRDIRVKGVRRAQVDEDKLALAFLLLAKLIADQRAAAEDAPEVDADPDREVA